jgi:CRP-like cAMP-binding protein
MNANIIHELRPISLGPRELLYQEGDDAKEIYFLQTGRVRLYVDLNNHIRDEHLLSIILDIQREKEIELAELGESLP